MTIDAYGIHIGSFLYFRFYGMIIMAGAIAAAYLARWMLKQTSRDPELVWDGLIWALIFGVIGARLYHIFTPSVEFIAEYGRWYYLKNPLDILLTWKGGLGMPGALAGGVLGLYLFARRRKLRLVELLDVAAPGVALAQAIGRWGNYVNQELYGPPTDLPWGIYIRPENRLYDYKSYERFHPLFLYESIWNLASAVFLLWLWRRHGDRLKAGDLFLIYLITYPIGRFFLEFLRLDYVPLFGVNINQWLMGATAAASAAALLIRHRRSPAG